ncbi:uncharacterized membrane protein YkvA (DUF1232 family) [Paenibacillus shirakamiensis]|uniref:Uncharacterized membrane protein YkvA (DUF1232 family) n=1 Tax=Paenibacillus shirakamiensis TaxID=1265935 RepID=A0ABS4JHH5_9BACL|nr:YkvA family protein [Paenibacillus shirakamiensis]MBP2001148.1 uncharacterized membrane protein YkvA (DUF1232 family) [Paenibacillus shirakamiensis]
MKPIHLKSVTYDPKQEEKVKRNFFDKLKGAAGKVPFVKDTVALYYCAVDSKTPLYVKGVAFAALAYFISPLDAIPDALAGLGFTDDAGVIITALKVVGNHVTDEHKAKAKAFFEKEKTLDLE